MGRLVPPEQDAGSEASEWERRECRERKEERRAKAEELGSRKSNRSSSPHPLHGICRRGLGDRSLFLFLCNFFGAHTSSWDRLGRRVKGSLQWATVRGQQTGTGPYISPP